MDYLPSDLFCKMPSLGEINDIFDWDAKSSDYNSFEELFSSINIQKSDAVADERGKREGCSSRVSDVKDEEDSDEIISFGDERDSVLENDNKVKAVPRYYTKNKRQFTEEQKKEETKCADYPARKKNGTFIIWNNEN